MMEKELQERILNKDLNKDPHERLFTTKEWEIRPKPQEVAMIIFKVDTPDEEAHTIKYPMGSWKQYVLGFDSTRDCITFAKILKDDLGFFQPTVIQMPHMELEKYCAELGVAVQCVAEGFDLNPPLARLAELDRNPDLREHKEQVEALFQSEQQQQPTILTQSTEEYKHSKGSWE